MSGNEPNPSQLYTVRDAAALMACSQANVYALIEAGEMPVVNVGRRKGYRIDARDLSAFIDGRRGRCQAPAVTGEMRPVVRHLRLG